MGEVADSDNGEGGTGETGRPGGVGNAVEEGGAGADEIKREEGSFMMEGSSSSPLLDCDGMPVAPISDA